MAWEIKLKKRSELNVECKKNYLEHVKNTLFNVKI